MPKQAKNKKKSKKQADNLLKENKKKIKTAIIIVGIIFLSFFMYRIWLNVHFLITDDLILLLEPQDKSLSIHYGEKPNVTMNADIENSFFCDAFCSYEFKDVSAKNLVNEGNFTIKGAGKNFKKDFQLTVDRTGSGQKIYSFEIQCNNIRTWRCLTNEKERKRSAFVALNYDISEYEKFLKENLKENITKLIGELRIVDVDVQELNNRFFKLWFKINLNEIGSEKEILNKEYNEIVLEFENLGIVWSEENYVLLSELFNKSYESRINSIKENIVDTNFKIDNIIETHNLIVDKINVLGSKIRDVDEEIMFLGRFNTNILSNHKSLLNKTNFIKDSISKNSFSDYYFIETEINNLESLFEDFKNEAGKELIDAYIKGIYYNNLEKENLCNVKGICYSKNNFNEAIKSSLVISDNEISNICLSIGNLKDTYEKENNKSSILIKNYNIGEIKNILDSAKAKKALIAKNNLFGEIKNINVSEKLNESLKILIDASKVNILNVNIDYGNFSESEIMLLVDVNLFNETKEYNKKYCGMDIINISQYYGNKTEVEKANDIEKSNFTTRISIELSENYAVCCVFGECKRCCTDEECKNDKALYPILFLHGHSFNKGNSPDYSLDAFNKIQTKLQEEGYVSLGTITPISDFSEIKKGEWGLSSKPISVKGSYYLVSYYNLSSYTFTTQKSENIETYAIRLKELIELLKFRTDKDKVIIVAHSMGGLVSRSYMQIFGDEDIEKLILIAVPNKGISGQVSNYCPVLGERKECEDMSENSIFIRKINDPNKIPKNVKVYNIIGSGCEMDDKNGDGVVVKENARLDYAKNYYINGTCEGFEVLHTDILDIDDYEEAYEIISNVLKEK